MNKLHTTQITTTGSKEKPISIDITYINNGQAKPLVLFVHGFKGFKDWGHFNLVANYFAKQHFVFAKFNFSHNGTTLDHPSEFIDLEAFGNNNYIFELNDIDSTLTALINHQELKSELNINEIYLIGHSRGGAMSIIETAEDTRIKKLVTWAAVSDIVNRNSQKTIETWQQQGVVHTYNMRTEQQMPLYLQFYETILANKDRLNVLAASERITAPFLIIHGTNDAAVKETDAHDLHKACPHSELLIVEAANHTFGGKHPWEEETLPPDSKLIIDKTISFLKQ